MHNTEGYFQQRGVCKDVEVEEERTEFLKLKSVPYSKSITCAEFRGV